MEPNLNVILQETNIFIETFYNPGLSQMGYYVESGGEAIVIDPLRDVEVYIKLAENRKARIKYVFLTHFHADFVAGHLELQRKTGCKIVVGKGRKADFNVKEVTDGETIALGEIIFKVIHTPGHTPEHVVYLLKNLQDKPYVMFTGDMLFAGDVGRPDLAVTENISERELGRMLFESIQKLKKFDDNILIFPGHGYESPCGKKIEEHFLTTLGKEKKDNYAFQILNADEFVETILKDQPVAPPYFFRTGQINRQNYKPLNKVLEENARFFNATDFKTKMTEKDSIVLDSRTKEEVWKTGLIPGSIQIGLDGNFELWVGTMINSEMPLLVVAPENRYWETISRLAVIGYENVAGILAGGIYNWLNYGFETVPIKAVLASEIDEYLNYDYKLLDIRSPQIFRQKHIDGAFNMPLNELKEKVHDLDKNSKYLIYCQSGYRSLIAYSSLIKLGFKPGNIRILQGGIDILSQINETIKINK